MIKKPVSNNVSIPECPFAIANAPIKITINNIFPIHFFNFLRKTSV